MADNEPVTELQLKAALEPITREVNDMKASVSHMSKIVTGNGSGVGLDEQARNNRRDIDKHDKLIEDLRPVIIFYKVGVWFASGIGVMVIALLWGLLTGQVEIFP